MLPLFKLVFPFRISSWRPIGRGCGWLGAVWILCGGPTLNAAEKISIPEFRFGTAFESVVQAAEVSGIALSGFAPLCKKTGVHLGDGVTVLLSLQDGKKHQQWLLELEATEVTAEEMGRPYDSVRFYTSTGHEFTFSGGRSALTMRMIGPLEESDQGKSRALKPKVTKRRILISSDFQTLGLQGVPRMSLRLQALRQSDPDYQPGPLNFGTEPFPEDTAASAQEQPGKDYISAADERAFIGGVIALKEILITVSRTPGLDDIMKKVVDVPWWSLVRSLGKMDLNIKSLNAYRELPIDYPRLSAEGTAFTWPNLLRINGKSAASFQLLIVEPKAPLGVMAGVIGMTAGHTDAKGPIFACRIIATKRASYDSDAE